MATKRKNIFDDDVVKKAREKAKASSPNGYTPRTAQQIGMEVLGREFGIDTFYDDLNKLNSTIKTVTGEWQTQETMDNTRQSILDMSKRLMAYNDYQSRYGGADLTDVSRSYHSLLGEWDGIKSVYGEYQDADSFGKAKTKAQFDYKFSKKDENGNVVGGLTFEEVQEELKKYEEGSDEYNYLKGYTGYTNLNDFDKAIEWEKGRHTNVKGEKNNTPATLQLQGESQGKKNLLDFSDAFPKSPTGMITIPDEANPELTKMKRDEIISNLEKNNNGIDREYIDSLERAKNKHELDHAFDRYKHYMDEEGFEETSQYKSTATENIFAPYKDETYEYINNVDGARDFINAKYKEGNGATEFEQKGYDRLTSDEVAVYNSLYAKDKKLAKKFLEDMEVTLTKRVYDKSTEIWKGMADSGAIQSSLLSLAVPITNLAGGIGSGVAFLTGDTNPYSPLKTASNFTTDTTQYVGENIAEATEGMELFGTNVPSFLYQTGMSVGNTVLGGATLGSLYSVVAGSNAFQQKEKELTEAGENSDVVFMNALASGTAEMLFEKASIDNWLKIKNVDGAKKFITETLKQAGIEGSEELFTELANIGAEALFRGDNSELAQLKKQLLEKGYSEEEANNEVLKQGARQVGEAFAGGLVSGGVLGGFSSTGNYAQNKSTGASIRANAQTDEMWDMSAMTPEESETYKLYTEYANKGVNAGNIKDAQLGNLYNTAEADAYEQSRSKKETDRINSATTRMKLDKISKPNTEELRKQRVESLNKGEVTEVTATGNSAKIEGFKKVDGDIVVATTEGEFKADEVTFSQNDAELLSYAENMNEDMASLFVSQYDGNANVDAYNDSFNLAVTYAENNISQDTMLENRGVLTPTQVGAIYTSIVTNKAKAQSRTIAKLMEKHGNTMSYKGTIDDSVIDYDSKTTDGSKVNWNSLTDSQRKGVTFLTGLAKATGLDAELVTDGLERGFNGAYMVENGKIVIDVYAGVNKLNMTEDSKDTIIPALSHEITHWSKAKSPEKYQSLSEDIFKVLTKGGKSEVQLINEEVVRLRSRGIDADVDYARDEIIARACEDMLAMSETGKEMFNGLSESERKSLLDKVKDLINDFVNWVNELLTHYESKSKEATYLRQYKEDLLEISKKWDAMFKESIEVNQAMKKEGITDEAIINETLDKVGLQFDANSKSVAPATQLSERTWTESEYVQDKEVAVKSIMKAVGVTRADAERYINNINSIAKMIADNRDRLDYEPNIDEYASVLKSNKEYKWTVDMSTLCAKRLLFTGTFDAIQKALPNTAFDSDDIVGLRSLMMSRGYEVACGICYVESTRREIGTITAEFIERYKLSQQTGKPITRVNSEGKVKELKKSKEQMETSADKSTDKFIADKNYTPTLAELNTTDIDLVKKEHPLVYEAYISFMNSRGQAKPKLLETRAEYKGEILKQFKTKSAVDSRNKAGGLRVQSFSDFEVAHLIDMMQVTLDMSRVGLMSQAYTKVPAFADVFGDTGIKINLSLIAKGSGLDENGNLIFDDVEGINHKEAFRLRDKYSKNVGTILVGKNDAHIIKAMADPRIDFIIPFHKSSWNESLYDALGLTGYENYTETQNEKYIDKSRGTAKNFQPSEYWDYSKTGDENAKVYLEMCKKDGIIPKFPQFQGYEGYWKLLIDFKMYDNDGVGSPQTTVKPNFSMNEAMQVLNAYEGGHRQLPVARDVVEDFIAEYKKNHPKTQYSDRDSDGTKLSKKQIEYFKDSKVRDEEGNLLVVYHGTRKADFTVFNRTHTYFTDSKDMADSYSPNGEGYKGYLNITNPFVVDAMGEKWSKVPIDAKMKAFLQEHSAGVFKEKGKWRTTPADIVYAIEDAIEEGTADYDGVIIKNVDDTGSHGNKQGIVSNDYIAFNSNQFKNVDNLNPTKDRDIRYSDRDSEGTQLTNEQVEYFKNSKIRDENGNLLVMYHGTQSDFTVFNPFIQGGKNGTAEGYGNYFTDSTEVSEVYGKQMKGYVNVTHPATAFGKTIKRVELEKLLKATCENEAKKMVEDDGYASVDEAIKDTWISNYEYTYDKTMSQVYRNVAQNIISMNEHDMDIIQEVMVGQGINNYERAYAFYDILKSTLGIDGFVTEWENPNISSGKSRIVVAFYSNQFKNADNTNPTKNEDIRYSDRYAPTFYSHMGRVVDDIKQDKIGANSVVSYLKGRGVKDEEIKWSGIETFLEGKKSVTKAELQEFVAGSMLQIDEEYVGNQNFIDFEKELKKHNIDLEDYQNWDDSINFEALMETLDNYYSDGDMDLDTVIDLMHTANILKYEDGTKWHQYKIDGGRNYRELLFKMPNSPYTNNAMKTHWGREGVLAHARIQDVMTKDGKKMLFIEEIQSDWHNEGHKHGYTNDVRIFKLKHLYNQMGEALRDFGDAKHMERAISLREEYTNLENELHADGISGKSIPDAPFRNNYHEYVLKRLIRMASEEGYDAIGWTTGKMQEERWSSDFAEGYRIEYDQDIPKFLRKYGKKWGAKVGTSTTTSGYDVWSMDITDSMKDSVLYEGQVMYSDRDSDTDIDAWLDNLSIDELMDYLMTYDPIDISDNKQEVKEKKQRAKRRVDEVNKRLKEIGLSFNGTKTVAWTDERINTYLGGGYYGSSNPIYAQAYITYMTPQQFLNLTMGGHEYTVDTILRESESYGELDFDKIANSEPIHLDIEEGKKGAKVYGHEGRHRMYLLGKAGFEKVPVLLFDYNTKYSKTNKESLKLETQKFYNDAFISKTRDVVVTDLIPFSQGNRDLIIEKFGSGNQDADIHFSDRIDDSVYDVMGENEALKKLNKILTEDVQRLRERVKLEGTVTKGKVFDANQLQSLAVYLNKSVNSAYSSKQLSKDLERLYSYIAQSKDIDEHSLFAKCQEIARNILAEQRGEKVVDDYYKGILDDLRSRRISLSEEQIKEVQSQYGDRYRNAFMGKIMIAKDGISLDSVWQELSQMYPEVFDAEITEADQPLVLLEIYDSARESSVIYQKYMDAETTMSLATEIYNKYWTAPRVTTVADKYTAEIKKLNFEHRKAMSDLRTDFNDRLQKQKTADAIHYGKIINDLRQREQSRVKEAKEFGRRRVNEVRDRAERNAKIRSITDKALTLNKWLLKNSKDEHIAEPLKKPVAYLLDAIDFSSKQLLGMRGDYKAHTPTQRDISLSQALEEVHEMARGIESAQIGEDDISAIYGTFADFPVGFADDVRSLSKEVNDIMRTVGDNEFVLNQMSLDSLKELDKIITTIKSTVTQMNKFLAVRHAQGVANLSQTDILYLDSLGKGKVEGRVKKMLNWGNALPYYAFKRFGKGGQKVYEALMDGWDKFSFHTKQIIDYAESVYTADEIKKWETDIKTFDVLEPTNDADLDDPNYKPTYQKIQMTVPQIMSLYCLQKREQAKDHLKGGGIRIADIEVKQGAKKNVISQSEGVIFAESEIETIINSLTDRQREVADKLQEFMNTVCTDWGNEVSMLRFGYKAFGEENYFPIQSDKNNLAVNDETENNNSLFRLLNMSFTKSTIKKANNRIVISNIFDVFAQHTSDMAKYNALALPVLDSFKWYNYKEKIKQGETQHKTKSLKQSLENAYGKNAQNYITTFLRDINGSENSSRDTVGKHFFTNAKIASVGMNLRVALLQPTSYLRASAVIDTKYLIRAMGHKPKIARAEKYCGIAQWKALGFYDTNIQRGVTELIKHSETVKDKAVEVSMKGAEWGDKVTWGYLWNACELEIRETRKDLKVGSNEFNNAIGKRLREIIYATQVVDSTMTRSQMMRSSDMYDKMLTSFASEPTLAYNMMQDASWEVKLAKRRGESRADMRKHKSHFLRVATAYTVTNTMCALIEAGFDAFRDEEEEEMDLATFMKMYLTNFATDMSFTAKVPYIKEIVSILQGYSSSRTDTQWMQSFGYALNGVKKIMEGKGDAYKTFKHLMRGLSYVSGLPFYNLWRDSMSLLNKSDILTAEELSETFNDAFGIEE